MPEARGVSRLSVTFTADDGSGQKLSYLAHGGESSGILLIDVNGDGFKDIVIATYSKDFTGEGAMNRIFLNVAHPTSKGRRAFFYDPCFQFEQNRHMSLQLTPIDWDNNGAIDFIASYQGEKNALLLNRISARGQCDSRSPLAAFREDKKTYAVSGLPLSDAEAVLFAAGDINGDGAGDLASYRKKCDLVFEDPAVSKVPASDCSIRLHVRDGSRFSTLPVSSLYQNKYGKTHTYDVLFTSLNNDAFPDIVYSTTESRALLHNGRRDRPEYLRPRQDALPYSVDNLIGSAQVLDLNGDSLPDMLSTNQGYTSCAQGDTDPDVAGEGSSSCYPLLTPIKYFKSVGVVDGSYRWVDTADRLGLPTSYVDSLSYPGVPCSGDLDGDLDVDLVIPYRDSENVLLLNRGDGSFVFEPTKLPVDPYKEDNAEVDTENHVTINQLEGVTLANNAVVKINPLVSSFIDDKEVYNLQFLRDNVNSKMPYGAQGCMIDDFDGDGKKDLIITYFIAKQDRFFRGVGTGRNFRFVEVGSGIAGSRNDFLAQSFDIDKDGDKDILSIARTNPRRVRLLRNNGRGQFGVEDVTSLFPAVDLSFVHKMKIENVLGDGEPEIIFVNFIQRNTNPLPANPQDVLIYTRTSQGRGVYRAVPGSNIVSVAESDRTDTEPYRPFLLANLETQDVTFLDLNGDGLQDLVKGKQVLKERVYLQQRLGRGEQFPRWVEATDDVLTPRNFKTYFVESADMNLDRKEDLIVFETTEPHLYLQKERSPEEIGAEQPVVVVDGDFVEGNSPVDDANSGLMNDNEFGGRRKGDVDGKGGVELADAILLAQSVLGIINQEFTIGVSDVTGDGIVGLDDAIQIARGIN